jgi:HemK-related putative methylase
LRRAIHVFAYHVLLKRSRARTAQVARFRLVLYPTVFHPRFFLTSEIFARFIDQLNLSGQRVAEIGTGSGILALAAARAGASDVVAIDVNVNAARSAKENARLNGFDDRVSVVCSNLLTAIAPRSLFDVILSNPPFFNGEPRDIADRAWCAGPGYRDIIGMFAQARERLRPNGRFYLLLSSDSDLHALAPAIGKSGFAARIAAKRSFALESFIIYELTAG